LKHLLAAMAGALGAAGRTIVTELQTAEFPGLK
jgi:hypothetical protein